MLVAELEERYSGRISCLMAGLVWLCLDRRRERPDRSGVTEVYFMLGPDFNVVENCRGEISHRVEICEKCPVNQDQIDITQQCYGYANA